MSTSTWIAVLFALGYLLFIYRGEPTERTGGNYNGPPLEGKTAKPSVVPPKPPRK